MSHYDEVLKEARAKASGTAKEYIPRLFHILVDEEGRKPEEARAIIEHDLISYWAKATVTKYIPREAKDEIKVKAGEEGAKATNLILTSGETVTRPADGQIPAEPPKVKDEPPEDPKDLEIQFLKEKVAELEDALKKTEQFKPATELAAPPISNPDEHYFKWLADREDKVSRYWFPNYGIELFRTRILSDLNNRGVKMFKRLYFEI